MDMNMVRSCSYIFNRLADGLMFYLLFVRPMVL